ncbi:MAG: DUF1801 domain-containing protein [Planctomycetes bacterium]|nr:DUF1801 domain-containing protein [Planctomycetota bacterium]
MGAKKTQEKQSITKMPKRATRPGKTHIGNSVFDIAKGRAEVDLFMHDLKHPMTPELESIRQLILGVSPSISEGIEWNSPSFRTSDWFATVNVVGGGRPPRPGDPPTLRLILHAGAKVKASSAKGLKIADPTGLLQWLARDRAMVMLTPKSSKEWEEQLAALKKIIKQWIAHL